MWHRPLHAIVELHMDFHIVMGKIHLAPKQHLAEKHQCGGIGNSGVTNMSLSAVG